MGLPGGSGKEEWLMAEFSAASAADVDVILDMICARMAWMDERGLRQWNATDYFGCYPRAYFEEGAARGDFYLLKEEGRPVGAVALFEKDGRWDDDPAYFYVHHLTTRPGHAGAGAAMLRFAEDLGRRRGKRGIRLDSAVDNPRLSAYYEDLGYPAVSTFLEGLYEGVRRVKYLDLPLAFCRAEGENLEELWEIEGQCFPENEMCLRENFKRRLARCPDHFLLLRRTDSGEICAFLSDIRSDAPHLTDDMFSGAVRHVPAGDGMMLLGLNVRPAYRGRGLASMLLRRRIGEARRMGLSRMVLTCHDHLLLYYSAFGFLPAGPALSQWGGTRWYEMVLPLK